MAQHSRFDEFVLGAVPVGVFELRLGDRRADLALEIAGQDRAGAGSG